MAKQSFIDRKLEEAGQFVATFTIEQTAFMRGYDSIDEDIEELIEAKNERLRTEAKARYMAKLSK